MADRKLALTFLFKGIDGLTGSLKNIAGGSGKAQAALKAMRGELRQDQDALGRLNDTAVKNGGLTEEMSFQQARLEDRIRATTLRIDEQTAAMARQQKADALGQRMRSKGSSNIQGGLFAAIPLALSVQQAASFQDGMVDIQQKAELSDAATARLKGNILAAAHAAKQLPESMRKGVDFLAGAGIQDARVLAGLMAPIGKAASAEKAEIEDLSKASFANYSNLQVPLDKTALALDAMTKAGKDGNVEIKDMAAYFPGLTAQMAALGQKGVPAVADLSAALEIAKQGAQDAAGAATNVQDLLASINTVKTEKAFKAYGVDLPAAMKKAYAQGKTPLEAIAELTKKALGGDLSKIPHLFRNQESASAVRQLALNMDQYRQIRTDALNAAGEVDKDFAKRSKDAALNMQGLMGDLQHLAIIVGYELLPPLVDLADKVSNLSDKFANWADKHPKLTALMVQATAAFIGAKIALGGLQWAFGGIVGPAMKAYNGVKWLYTFGKAAGFVEEGAPLISGALIGLGTAMDTMGAAFMAAAPGILAAAWPIAAIVAGVALLGAGVYWLVKHWEPVKAFFGAFFGSLYQSFKPAVDGIMGVVHTIGGVWNKVEPIFAKGLKLLGMAILNFTPVGLFIQAFMPVFDWFKKIDWSALGKSIMQGIIDGIWFMLGPFGLILKKAVDAGVAAFKDKAQIHSPSRVFMGLGSNLTEGLRLGIARSADGPVRQIRTLTAGVAGAAMIAASPAGAAAMPQAAPITINVYAAPGQNAHEIAAAVEAALSRHQAAAAAKARSAYKDPDE